MPPPSTPWVLKQGPEITNKILLFIIQRNFIWLRISIKYQLKCLRTIAVINAEGSGRGVVFQHRTFTYGFGLKNEHVFVSD